MFVIPFPAINPIALGPYALGPFSIAIRWYALAYIVGLLIGWRYCLALADRPPRLVRRQDVDDFLVWATIGVVLGGRIGYVLFYNAPYYATHPLQAFEVWHGGMSFHGGALGVTLAIILFARQRRVPVFAFSDIITEAIPIGLFFGRIANFINGELFGRPSRRALGDDLSEWRPGAALPEPALSRRASKASSCSSCCSSPSGAARGGGPGS